MKTKIESYPLEWPRRLDFIPALKIQARTDPKSELFYCDATVSTSENLGRETRKTEFGVLVHNPSDAHKVKYTKGQPDPHKEVEPVS